MWKLNITDDVLDKLGFSEYWDKGGNWGFRNLKFSNETNLRITEQEAIEDDSYGYGEPRYIAHHWAFNLWSATPEIKKEGYQYRDLFFLHELYQVIEEFYPNCLSEFVAKCEAVNMKCYIDWYLTYRQGMETTTTYQLRFIVDYIGPYDTVFYQKGDYLWRRDEPTIPEFTPDQIAGWYRQGSITDVVGHGIQNDYSFPSSFEIIEVTRTIETNSTVVGWNELASKLRVPGYIPFV